YLGWEVQPFHWAGLECYLKNMRSMWLAPRGSGKSTCAIMVCAWLAISEPRFRLPDLQDLFPDAPRTIDPSNIRIALTTNSSEKAKELHAQVRGILEHGSIRLVYQMDLRGARWKDHASTTSLRDMQLREGTFTALGLGSKVTGGHYDVVLLDDWVTEDSARTEAQRNKLVQFWARTVKPTCEPWARVMGAGTRYHPKDFYQNVWDWVEAGLWQKMLHHRALIEVGEGKFKSYWPSAYSVEQLLAIREEVGSMAFETQYQNEINLMMGDFFDQEWLSHFYVWDELPSSVRTACMAHCIMTLDPAIKAGKRNDYSVFTILCYAAPNFYVRKVVRGQWTEEQMKAMAVLLCKEFRPRQFGVEVVGGMEFLVQSMRRMPQLPRVIALRPMQYRGKDKVGRASHVRQFFEQGRVRLPEPDGSNGIGRLIEECMAFPGASNVPGWDDCVDSLVWGLLLVTRARNRLVKLRR
ncbi:hypothetical protein LCGC14_2072000, partial [marine sediment metagenome]